MQNAPAICANAHASVDYWRITGRIGSSFGLVLTNALVATELSMFVDWPETGFGEIKWMISSKPTCGPK
jgi:hypothetical protein